MPANAGIHVFLAHIAKTWMPGTRPGMTEDRFSQEHFREQYIALSGRDRA
jgi:hypothetical protein